MAEGVVALTLAGGADRAQRPVRRRARAGVNEDAYLAEAPVYLVADGMEGHARGDAASRAVVETFKRISKRRVCLVARAGARRDPQLQRRGPGARQGRRGRHRGRRHHSRRGRPRRRRRRGGVPLDGLQRRRLPHLLVGRPHARAARCRSLGGAKARRRRADPRRPGRATPRAERDHEGPRRRRVRRPRHLADSRGRSPGLPGLLRQALKEVDDQTARTSSRATPGHAAGLAGELVEAALAHGGRDNVTAVVVESGARRRGRRRRGDARSRVEICAAGRRLARPRTGGGRRWRRIGVIPRAWFAAVRGGRSSSFRRLRRVARGALAIVDRQRPHTAGLDRLTAQESPRRRRSPSWCAISDAGNARIVVRESITGHAGGAAVHGTGVSTWVERVVDRAADVQVEVDGADVPPRRATAGARGRGAGHLSVASAGVEGSRCRRPSGRTPSACSACSVRSDGRPCDDIRAAARCRSSPGAVGTAASAGAGRRAHSGSAAGIGRADDGPGRGDDRERGVARASERRACQAAQSRPCRRLHRSRQRHVDGRSRRRPRRHDRCEHRHPAPP